MEVTGNPASDVIIDTVKIGINEHPLHWHWIGEVAWQVGEDKESHWK